MDVLEPIGPQLAQTDKITVPLFAILGPVSLVEDVLMVLRHKADPLVENRELSREHKEDLKAGQ